VAGSAVLHRSALSCSRYERCSTFPISIALDEARRPLAVLPKDFSNCAGQAMSTSLTHIDAEGTARMVDVGAKAETQRLAVASGRIRMSPEALDAIRAGDAPKGDVLGTARIAGIMAAKRTGDLIPMCHPLAIDAVNIDFAFEDAAVRATATASLTGKTGIEMEAITAVTIALVTVYDMAKALDKAMVIDDVRLIEKRGGKSGHWRASDA
jgi:cyclic pyranopterin phosphate synthase